MDAGVSCFFGCFFFFALHPIFLSKLHQVSKKTVPLHSLVELSCRSAANLSASLKYHFKQEAEQEANKNEPLPETECAHLRKRQLGRNERGQRVKLCRTFIHHWSFMIQQTGAASHRDDLSVACSHLCPDVHSAGLLKEKNHSAA